MISATTHCVLLYKKKISSFYIMDRLSRKQLLELIKELQIKNNALESVLETSIVGHSFSTEWATLDKATDSIFSRYLSKLSDDLKFHFVTQTFDQKYFLPKNIDQQVHYFHKCIDDVQTKYKLKYVLYVLEQHSSGVVHAHLFLIHNKQDYNILIDFEYDLRSFFTNTPRCYNRKNQQVDVVKETIEDFTRICDYMSKKPLSIRQTIDKSFLTSDKKKQLRPEYKST